MRTMAKTGSYDELSALAIENPGLKGTDETYRVKTGRTAMQCASLIGVLFVCPRSLPVA